MSKFGFIHPFYKGYHKLTKKFINSTNPEIKKNIFSEVFYEFASFNSSATKDNRDLKQINFLLKSLMYHPDKKLSKEDITALMVTDISQFKKGYLTFKELKSQYEYSKAISFSEKKYNQLSYLFGFLSLMPDLKVSKENGITFVEDNNVIQNIDTSRDPYMHNIYRQNLKQESFTFYNDVVCYVEKINQKGLVASHIKPCNVCLSEADIDSAYDYNNGILLQPNIDAYFDKFDLTFKDNGNIVFSDIIPKEFKNKIYMFKLDKEILNSDRLKYLKYHRDYFYTKHKIKTS